MENPQSWKLAEHVISEAIDRAYKAHTDGVIGASTVMIVATALREAGLLDDADQEPLRVFDGRQQVRDAIQRTRQRVRDGTTTELMIDDTHFENPIGGY